MSTVHVILPGTTPGMSSREQFMPAYEGRSLFQLCIEYNSSFADRQLVVGNHDYYAYAKDYFKLTGNKTYLSIIEEDRLTNVYSVAFAAFGAGTEEILLITPSGYSINEEESYKNTVKKMVLIAKEGHIGALFFHSEQAIDNMPFIVYEEGRVKFLEEITDSKQIETRSKKKKQFIYSGILCCKAGVYLEELKIWAPDIYQVAKNAWEGRVAQYVAVDTNIKMLMKTIEQVLLTISDKVKVEIELTAKLRRPVKKSDDQIASNEKTKSETNGDRKGPKMLGLVL